MQYPWTSIALIGILLFVFSKTSGSSLAINTSVSSEREMIKNRFQHLQLPFDGQYNPQVEQYILSYLTNGRRETEKTLGRAALYFPLFEYYLRERQLPEELKLIPFIESRLQPYAKSTAGATGLWQFMPATARSYHLKTTTELDERLDPHRSTEAAVELLAQLYEEFGDWGLALAAYNCGPGRVKKAIKKTNCHNFWDIKHLLPPQTQRYIPAFMAASYVAHYYQLHQIMPRAPRRLPLDNYSIKIHQKVRFTEITNITGLPADLIRRLNPGYTLQVIPASESGHIIILPAQAACALEDYLLRQQPIASIPVPEVWVHDRAYAFDLLNSGTELNEVEQC